MFVAIVYLALKLMFWHSFPLGFAPVVIGLFFLFGIQLMFIGILGEYIGSIHNYLQRRPVVVEKERINFDRPAPGNSDSKISGSPAQPEPYREWQTEGQAHEMGEKESRTFIRRRNGLGSAAGRQDAGGVS
jgi:hypothetical protein